MLNKNKMKTKQSKTQTGKNCARKKGVNLAGKQLQACNFDLKVRVFHFGLQVLAVIQKSLRNGHRAKSIRPFSVGMCLGKLYSFSA